MFEVCVGDTFWSNLGHASATEPHAVVLVQYGVMRADEGVVGVSVSARCSQRIRVGALLACSFLGRLCAWWVSDSSVSILLIHILSLYGESVVRLPTVVGKGGMPKFGAGVEVSMYCWMAHSNWG